MVASSDGHCSPASLANCWLNLTIVNARAEWLGPCGAIVRDGERQPTDRSAADQSWRCATADVWAPGNWWCWCRRTGPCRWQTGRDTWTTPCRCVQHRPHPTTFTERVCGLNGRSTWTELCDGASVPNDRPMGNWLDVCETVSTLTLHSASSPKCLFSLETFWAFKSGRSWAKTAPSPLENARSGNSAVASGEKKITTTKKTERLKSGAAIERSNRRFKRTSVFCCFDSWT